MLLQEQPALASLAKINTLEESTFREVMTRCCGARRWVDGMLRQRPFADHQALFQAAEEVWWQLLPEDWLEAFTHHPKIGDVDSLREKFRKTATWSEGEQAGVQQASEKVLADLAHGNQVYEEKFGYIFIVCATGKSADEMLAILNQRLSNDAEIELRVAAGEQAQITRLRLDKLLNEGSQPMKSPITTHVLDTAQGRPARGIQTVLEFDEGGGRWKTLAQGVTNDDGRIMDLLPAEAALHPGVYRMTFATGDYLQQFGQNGNTGFYPYVPVVFEIREPDHHYHVPLLLSPYGYSTYRGS